MTTITAYVTAVSGLTISGVTRKYGYRPAMINDLPAQFVELPEAGRDETYVTTCSGSGKTRTVDLVVCLEAMNQDRHEPNYDATVTMMDSMETALDALRKSTYPMLDYDISAGRKDVGDAGYWAATATVTMTDL